MYGRPGFSDPAKSNRAGIASVCNYARFPRERSVRKWVRIPGRTGDMAILEQSM